MIPLKYRLFSPSVAMAAVTFLPSRSSNFNGGSVASSRSKLKSRESASWPVNSVIRTASWPNSVLIESMRSVCVYIRFPSDVHKGTIGSYAHLHSIDLRPVRQTGEDTARNCRQQSAGQNVV